MNMCRAFLATLVLIPLQPRAVSVPLDLTGVRPGPITVVRSEDSVTVTWPDETARVWRATFSLNPAQPLIASIGAGGEGQGSANVLTREVREIAQNRVFRHPASKVLQHVVHRDTCAVDTWLSAANGRIH